MKDHNKTQEEFFTHLMKKTKLEEPNLHFTSKVMEKIHAVQTTEKHTIFVYNKWSWILLSIAAVMIIFVVIFGDFSFVGNMFNNIGTENLALVSILSNIINSVGAVFESLQMSTLSGLIILSAIFLFVLDRLIRKFKPTHFMMI